MSLSPSQSRSATTAQGGDPRPKRIRLSLACNQCRKRKVRCDTTLPKCRNCVLRDEDCQTTDPRNPDKGLTVRSLATKDASFVQPQWNENRNVRSPSVGRELPGANIPLGSSEHSEVQPSPDKIESAQRKDDEPSWQERAYTESTLSVGNSSLPVATPDLVVNTDDTSHRVKYLGGSSVQCLCRFVDLHLVHRGLEPASSRFKHGMMQSEEITLPLIPSLPDLPPSDEIKQYINTFFDRIWPIFPIVDREVIQADVDNLCELQLTSAGSLASRVTVTNIPSIVIIYAVISIGADESIGRLSEISTKFLAAAYSLYAHLIASPYMSSVQALLLLAIALRVQVKDGQAWHLIGQAIRIAHSIGLHKRAMQCRQHIDDEVAGASIDQSQMPLPKRLWWSLYALEKLTQLESGRPSIIDGGDDEQVPRVSLSLKNRNSDYFTAWISLSCIIGRISELIYSRRPAGASDLITKTAQLDGALVEWERDWVDTLRPGQGSMTFRDDSVNDQHLSGFLSLQFYHAHITLLRAAIIFPYDSYTAEVAKHASTLPSYSRMFNGANICASAARTLITQTLNLADQGVRSTIIGATPPYMAAVVLALTILRRPTRRLARADLELLNLATEHVEDHFTRWVHNKVFIEGCAILRQQVNTVFHQVASETKLAGSSRPREPPELLPLNHKEAQELDGSIVSDLAHKNLEEWSEELFGGLQFDELWDMVGSDLLMGDHLSIF